MTLTPRILGYNSKGEPIHPIPEGMIATAAIISCYNCYKIIRSMGGPMNGSLCVDCYEALKPK